MDEKIKKALWISDDLHKEVKIFAIKNNMNIETASQMILKLGMCSYKAEKKNGSK